MSALPTMRVLMVLLVCLSVISQPDDITAYYERLRSQLNSVKLNSLSNFDAKAGTSLVVEYPNLAEFDTFLAAHPYWDVLWQTLHMAIVMRVPEKVKADMEVMIRRNFPARCDRKLIVNYIGQSSWGERWNKLAIALSRSDSNAIYTLFSPNGGNPSDGMGFLQAEECAKTNKLDCLFLLSTNCSLPHNASLVTTFAAHEVSRFAVEKVFSSSSSSSSASLATSQPIGEVSSSLIQTLFARAVPPAGEGVGGWINKTTSSISTKPVHLSSALKQIHGFYKRLNSTFRLKVQRLIQNFRLSFSPPFLPNRSCVALHIRRGDRKLKGVEDMTAWCLNHTTRGEVKENIMWFDGTRKMEWYDSLNLGCQFRIPYGAASLVHFLNASAVIEPTIRTVFIMTDEGESVLEEVKEYFASFRPNHSSSSSPSSPSPSSFSDPGESYSIYTFPTSIDSQGGRRRSLDVSAEFFASLLIARQCSGLVGYLPFLREGLQGSMATKALFEYMCFQHAGKFYSCPHTYTLSSNW